MTFKQLFVSVENYLRVSGEEMRQRIKEEINEAIKDFMREDEWLRLTQTKQFTTDNTDTYSISSTILTPATDPVFDGEVALVPDSDLPEYNKLDIRVYLQQVTKTGFWSVSGDTLYVTGTGQTFNLIYNSPGILDQLTSDAETNDVLTYYSDIIKKMVVVKMAADLGDQGKAVLENQLLQDKLRKLKQRENRIRKEGVLKFVGSHNR